MPANTTKASLRGPVLAFSALIAIAGLLLLATAVHAEKTTWTTRETITRREANVYLTCRWDPLEGIPIRLSRPDGSRAAEGIVGRRRTHFIWTVGRPGNDRGLNDRIRTHTVPLPDSPQDVELTLRRRARGWSLYLDAYLAAELPEIDPGDIVIEHAATALPSAEALDVLVQKVAPFTFADAFMVPEDAEQKLGAWEIIAGNWGLHTAAENLELHGRYKKNRRSQRPEADSSPNFYSLGGAGTNAMMVTGYDFYDRYTVRAAVKAADGECGLAFLVSIDGACHAFTLRRNPDTGRLDALLWRSPTGTIDDRKLLGAARTELLPDQWYRLEVEIHDRRLVARIDHIDVIDVTLPLPAGGRFGLFADHTVGTRFDDVEAWSHHDLAPADDGELTDITLSRPHGFSTKRGQLPGLPAGPRWQRQTRHLLARPRKERAVWHVGAPTDPPSAIAMRFNPEEEATFGLVAGHTAPDTWGAVFTCKTSGDQRVYRLERQTPGGTALLDTVTNRVPDADAPLDLRLDMTEQDAVRAYADNRLVLLCPSNTLSGGAVGWVVDAGSKVRMSLPVVETRPLRFRNRFEKNRNFVDDPFMRHWSSPEGQWVTLADKRTWYKGDFFGRYALHLPYKPKTTLHLGVPEQSEVGVLRISNTNDAVHVSWHGNPAATNGVMLGSIPAAELRMHSIDAKTSLKWLSIEQQDNLLWIHSKGRTLLRTHLPAIPTGRRIRAEGYGMDDLKFSQVDRYRVLDCLFTESPFRWTLHGGRWEIVNRFQCQPRWSHMNGENAEGLAALWSKYAIEGDFCVEFYAGERHEWYERAGDLNLTVLNESNSPADGYTVACTTWDPDFSQEQTHLYRNGAKVADSDKYLVPRVRDGQKRKGYNPLVTAGRDMHGAWYYMKLRRAGSNVSYHFDNEPVFTYDDPDPLASGAMGIWTYRNSMVVARVTIAAEKIAPRRFKFAPLALDRVPRRTTPVDETAHTPPANLTIAWGAPIGNSWGP